jgi:NAD(P)H-hydrate epimerase
VEESMIKVVTAEEMQKKDKHATEKIGIPGVVLMENAGLETAKIILDLLSDIEMPLVHIFCGKGNNGGDGFVVARHLANNGVEVEVFCTASEDEYQGDALINYNIAKNMEIPIEYLNREVDLDTYSDYDIPDLIVDALLGTGIKGAVKGFAKEIIDLMNDFEVPVVAIDLPSGLNANSGTVEGVAVFADATVTMGLPKRCHIFYPAKYNIGDMHIADISIPLPLLIDDELKVELVEKEDIRLPFRPADAHKYQFGKVAVLAGSPGYTGAAVLTAEAALKMGAGLVIAGVSESLNPIYEQKLTEVITRPLPETASHTIGTKSLGVIKELLDWCDVLAIGPGLGRSKEVQATIIEILKSFEKPAVVDADALFVLANHPDVLKNTNSSNWILTPHAGEFLRFTPNVSKEDLQKSPIEIGQRFSSEFGAILLLKGSPSMVINPAGNVFINSTGNSGLASGGSGDVLTGFIAGLLAQKFSTEEAAYTANFIHGFTADYIAEKENQYTLVAGDLISELKNTIRFLQNKELDVT